MVAEQINIDLGQNYVRKSVQVALGRTRLSAMTMIEKWRGSGREKNWENP